MKAPAAQCSPGECGEALDYVKFATSDSEPLGEERDNKERSFLLQELSAKITNLYRMTVVIFNNECAAGSDVTISLEEFQTRSRSLAAGPVSRILSAGDQQDGHSSGPLITGRL